MCFRAQKTQTKQPGSGWALIIFPNGDNDEPIAVLNMAIMIAHRGTGERAVPVEHKYTYTQESNEEMCCMFLWMYNVFTDCLFFALYVD